MTGLIAGARVVDGKDEEVMLMSANCQVFRTSLNEIPVQGRNTRGVIMWRPDGDDQVASIACLPDAVLDLGGNENGHKDKEEKKVTVRSLNGDVQQGAFGEF